MKLLKLLVALSLINAFVVIGIIGWGSMSAPMTHTQVPTAQDSSLQMIPLASPTVLPVSTLAPSVAPRPTESPKPLPKPSLVATPSVTPSSPTTTLPSPLPSPTPTPTPTPPPTPTPTPTPDNRCLIMIDGATYDVTSYRTQHPGGNIFSCGTDMSQTFWDRHNQDTLNKMQRYRI